MIPRGAAISLTALYSIIFFYHRSYDLLILALPVAFAAIEAGREPEMTAWGALALLAMFVNPSGMRAIAEWSFALGCGWGQVVRAIVLPITTWLILGALAGLWSSVRRASPG